MRQRIDLQLLWFLYTIVPHSCSYNTLKHHNFLSLCWFCSALCFKIDQWLSIQNCLALFLFGYVHIVLMSSPFQHEIALIFLLTFCAACNFKTITWLNSHKPCALPHHQYFCWLCSACSFIIVSWLSGSRSVSSCSAIRLRRRVPTCNRNGKKYAFEANKACYFLWMRK